MSGSSHPQDRAATLGPHRGDGSVCDSHVLRPHWTPCATCAGALCTLPGDRDYDAARTPWNLQVDARPAAVAYPAFADEVVDFLRAAADADLKVAPQGPVMARRPSPDGSATRFCCAPRR